jgi:hypothetical protein
MPDEKKPDLNSVRMIFRTLAIERGMPEVAMKYVKSLGLSKKDYNNVISQSVDKNARNEAIAAVTASGRPLAVKSLGAGKKRVESPADTLAQMGRLIKKTKTKFDTRKAPKGWGSVETMVDDSRMADMKNAREAFGKQQLDTEIGSIQDRLDKLYKVINPDKDGQPTNWRKDMTEYEQLSAKLADLYDKYDRLFP